MRISDWSSDVCSSDLRGKRRARAQLVEELGREHRLFRPALADVVPAFRAGADEDDGRNANAADQRDERDGEQAQARGCCFSANLHAFFPSRRSLLSAWSREAVSRTMRRSEERRVGKECGGTGRTRG